MCVLIPFVPFGEGEVPATHIDLFTPIFCIGMQRAGIPGTNVAKALSENREYTKPIIANLLKSGGYNADEILLAINSY